MSAQIRDLLSQSTHRFRSAAQRPVPACLSPNEENGGQTHDRRLLLVLVLVEENMRRQLAIRDLAAAVNLSSGRLAHLFKSEVGVSPQRYLNNMRMEKAKELLENGLLSCKEIAVEVGIPNPSRFCRGFKARYGTTPMEYRKTHLRLDLKSIGAAAASAQLQSRSSKCLRK
jgi:transcriptional regulator GlxA family with amidase domain